MKVDFLTMNFTTYIISSRTKHESFDSFGSHAQLFHLFMGIPVVYIFSCNEPVLSFVCIFNDIETHTIPEYLENSSDQTKDP